jgi:hypothetical protein
MATKGRYSGHTAAERVRFRGSVRIIMAAVTGIFVVSASAVAVASTASGSAPRGHRIHIVTVLASSATNSAGLGGPGDVVAQVFSFQLGGGAAGHVDASVQLVSTSEQLSHVAFVFPRGQIDAQAAVALPPTNFTAAITGGTGAYEGVAGEVVNTVISTAPLTIDRTLHLIYPDNRD